MFDWTVYRRVKLRLMLLLCGVLPCSAYLAILPLSPADYSANYAVGACYLLLTSAALWRYSFYPCVNCRSPYAGKQLFRTRCPRCGILINP